MIKPEEKFVDVKGPFLGMNTFDDASSIAPVESPEMTNISLDAGIISPRKGSVTHREKPSGESGDPLQTIVAKTSDGNEYLIAIYANHFYVEHEVNDEWVRINQTYVQAETTLPYGWQNWNNGRGDDRLYVCNGVDNYARWDICVSTVSGAHSAGATTLLLSDATRFPAAGTVVIKMSDGTEFTEAYTSKTSNTLNLTNTLNNALDGGESVVMNMAEKSGMEIGKIVGKHRGRLFSINYYGGETTVWYSKTSDPEDWTAASTVVGAGTEVISDGNGQITGFHDFGEYAVIEKEDSLHSFKFIIADDLGSKLTEIVPISSGQSYGPLGQFSTVKVLGQLMFPTRTEGFLSVFPQASGSQSSVKTDILSQKIQNYVTQKLGYDSCKGQVFDQKVFWAVALKDSTQNTLVLVYDTLRQSWSKYSNSWAVKDWAYKGRKLYYLDNSTGNIIKVLDSAYNDDNDPYLTEYYTPRHDFGSISVPKTEDNIYVQGYMTPATDLYVDVLFNEGGTLNKQTFRLNKDTERIYFSQPLTNAQGEFILGTMATGYVIISEIGDVSIFRCYLGISNRHGFYNLQLRFYSNKESFWGISGYSFNPMLASVIPASNVISPINTI